MRRAARLFAGTVPAALLLLGLAGCDGSTPTSRTTAIASATLTPSGPQSASPAPSSAPGPGDPQPAPAPAAPGPAPAPSGRAIPASCHRASVAALAATSGLSAPVTWRVRGCTTRWLVLDLSGTPAGCTSMNGDSTLPGCGPDPRLRWFARASAKGWRLVAAGPASGCTDVHDAEPDFPSSLCRSLRALPQN